MSLFLPPSLRTCGGLHAGRTTATRSGSVLRVARSCVKSVRTTGAMPPFLTEWLKA